ncbi:MAG: type II toxin-antitoxin system RelE/ParE family toxin [Rickettsiales bacterium]
MAKFIVADEVRGDLDTIWFYIAQDNPDTADKVENEITRSFYLLAENPMTGHTREDLTSRNVQFWSIYSYLIIYDATTKPISIVRVLSSFRDIAAIL